MHLHATTSCWERQSLTKTRVELDIKFTLPFLSNFAKENALTSDVQSDDVALEQTLYLDTGLAE